MTSGIYTRTEGYKQHLRESKQKAKQEGRLIPWNKGLTKDNDIRVKNQSNTLQRHFLINGANTIGKHWKLSEETKTNKTYLERNKKLKVPKSELHIQHIKESRIDYNKNKTYEEIFGLEKAQEIKLKISKNCPVKKKKHFRLRTLEFRKEQSIKTKENWQSKSFEEKQEIVKKVFESSQRSPNNFEQNFMQEASKLSLPIKFTGDFSFWIRLPKTIQLEQDNQLISYQTNQYAINPDCIITPFHETHKVIELLGNYWHHLIHLSSNPSYTKEMEETRLTRLYQSKNIQVLFIWEDDFYKNKEIVMNKVKDFVNNKIEVKI